MSAKDTVKTAVDNIYKYKKLLQSWSDKVIVAEDMGVKKLAYEVKSHTKGHYALFTFRCPEENIAELERLLRTDDLVIKFMTVRLDDEDAEVKLTKDYDPALDPDLKSEQHPAAGEAVQIDAMDVLLGFADYNKGGQ